MPVAVMGAGKPAPHTIERPRQHPIPERRVVTQSAGLARQNRHIMPGVVDRLASSVAARMFGHHAPFLADDDPIGVGVDIHGASDRTGLTEYLLLSNRIRQVFDTEAGRAWNRSKRPR